MPKKKTSSNRGAGKSADLLETLPWFLHWIGWISPLWHAAELGRAALYDAPLTPMMLLVHLGFLALLALVTCWLSIRTFRRRLDK